MPEGVKIRPVPQDELDVSFSGPAPAANRFFINIGPTGVRIAFTEQVPNSSKNYFRSAATLSIIDATQLHQVLSKMMATYEQAVERAQKDEEGKASEGG